jgi:uncharacterized protein (DUF1501 family)
VAHGSAGASNKSALNSDARLVVVMLRGAYDGLSAFYPYADPYYTQHRPNIALGRGEAEQDKPYLLDDQFALHPALSALIPFWESKRFAFVPCAGLSKPYRSHFEAQHYLEIGQDGKNGAANGWLNQLASLERSAQLIGVGEANPEILRGELAAQLVPRGNAALQTGVLSNPHHREVLEDLYARDRSLSQLFAQGEGSRVSTAMVLNQAKMNAASEQMMANKDAAPPSALLQDSQYLVTLMEKNPELKFGFLSAGGWDTHANQGNEKGALANNLKNLGQALAHLQNKLHQPNDLIVVMSEFGRTVRENASRGTDHGFGNAMMVMGQRVNGGKRLGRWEGLSPDQLNESRDVPVFHDYRQVMAPILHKMFELDAKQIAQVFPSFDAAQCERCKGFDLSQQMLID